jgi:hypothetical protein
MTFTSRDFYNDFLSIKNDPEYNSLPEPQKKEINEWGKSIYKQLAQKEGKVGDIPDVSFYEQQEYKKIEPEPARTPAYDYQEKLSVYKTLEKHFPTTEEERKKLWAEVEKSKPDFGAEDYATGAGKSLLRLPSKVISTLTGIGGLVPTVAGAGAGWLADKTLGEGAVKSWAKDIRTAGEDTIRLSNLIDSYARKVVPTNQVSPETLKDFWNSPFSEKVMLAVENVPEQLATMLVPTASAKYGHGAAMLAGQKLAAAKTLLTKVPVLTSLLAKWGPAKSAKMFSWLGSSVQAGSFIGKDQVGETGETHLPSLIISAPISGLLESLVPSMAVNLWGGFKPGSTQAMQHLVRKGGVGGLYELFKHIAKESGKSAATEFATEVLQESLQMYSLEWAKGAKGEGLMDAWKQTEKILKKEGFGGLAEAIKTSPKINQVVQAGILGAISGGIFEGAQQSYGAGRYAFSPTRTKHEMLLGDQATKDRAKEKWNNIWTSKEKTRANKEALEQSVLALSDIESSPEEITEARQVFENSPVNAQVRNLHFLHPVHRGDVFGKLDPETSTQVFNLWPTSVQAETIMHAQPEIAQRLYSYLGEAQQDGVAKEIARQDYVLSEVQKRIQSRPEAIQEQDNTSKAPTAEDFISQLGTLAPEDIAHGQGPEFEQYIQALADSSESDPESKAKSNIRDLASQLYNDPGRKEELTHLFPIIEDDPQSEGYVGTEDVAGIAQFGKQTQVRAGERLKADGVYAGIDLEFLQPETAVGDSQNRNRAESAASEAQVKKIEAYPDPDRLISNDVFANDGPMVVAVDNLSAITSRERSVSESNPVIVAGNGRILGIKSAYKKGNTNDYVQSLINKSQEFGIDPRSFQKYTMPGLVRLIDKESIQNGTYKDFVLESNKSRNMGLLSSEKARTDGQAILEFLGKLETSAENLNTQANQPFFNEFFDKVVTSIEERAPYFTTDGKQLSQDGIARVKNAIFQAAYKDPHLLMKMADEPDPAIRSVLNGLQTAAPDVARLASQIEREDVHDISLAEPIAQAAQKISELRKEGALPQTYFEQGQFGVDTLSPAARIMLGFFATQKSQQKINRLLREFNQVVRSLGSPNQMQFAGMETSAPETLELLESVIKKEFPEVADNLEHWKAGPPSLGMEVSLSSRSEKGKPVTIESLDAEINKIQRNVHQTGVILHPVETIEQAQSFVPSKIRPRTEGFYLPKEGLVVLVAENISDMDRARKIIAHEIVGHHLLPLYLGEEKTSWARELEQLKNEDAFVRKVYDEEVAPYYSSGEESSELAARLAERFGTIPGKVSEKAKRWIERKLSDINSFLRSIGIGKEFDLNDLSTVIQATRDIMTGADQNIHYLYDVEDEEKQKNNPELSVATRQISPVNYPETLAKVHPSTSVAKLNKHPEYQAAKTEGDAQAAMNVVRDIVNDKVIADLKSNLDRNRPVVFVPILDFEGQQNNMLPMAYAAYLASRLNGQVLTDVFQRKRNIPDGSDKLRVASPDSRTKTDTEFVGDIPSSDHQVVIVDDVFTSGNTFTAMIDKMNEGGNMPVAATALAMGRYQNWLKITPEKAQAVLNKAKMNPLEFEHTFGYPVENLTGSEAQAYILNGARGKAGAKKRFPVSSSYLDETRMVAEPDRQKRTIGEKFAEVLYSLSGEHEQITTVDGEQKKSTVPGQITRKESSIKLNDYEQTPLEALLNQLHYKEESTGDSRSPTVLIERLGATENSQKSRNNEDAARPDDAKIVEDRRDSIGRSSGNPNPTPESANDPELSLPRNSSTRPSIDNNITIRKNIKSEDKTSRDDPEYSIKTTGFKTMPVVNAKNEQLPRGDSNIENDPGAVYFDEDNSATNWLEYAQYLQEKYETRDVDYILSELASRAEIYKYERMAGHRHNDPYAPAFEGRIGNRDEYGYPDTPFENTRFRREQERQRGRLEQAQPDGGPEDTIIRYSQKLRDIEFAEDETVPVHLDIRGSNAEISAKAAEIFSSWPEKVKAADGVEVFLKNKETGRLSSRLRHLIWNNTTNRLDLKKAEWIANVPETLSFAAIRLLDPQTQNRIYVRAYQNGDKHMVIVRPDGTIENQDIVSARLITQFPYTDKNRREGMEIEWTDSTKIIEDRGNRIRRSSGNPNLTPEPDNDPELSSLRNSSTRTSTNNNITIRKNIKSGDKIDYAIAHHGTPHTLAPEPGFPHGRFRLDKVGSGEGNQSYGWGIYFAENQEVAEGYKERLRDTVKPGIISVDGVEYNWKDALDKFVDPVEAKALKKLGDKRSFDLDNFLFDDVMPEIRDTLNLAPEEHWKVDFPEDISSHYRLDIPDEVMPKLLDWEKNLSEQSQFIKNIFKNRIADLEIPGEMLYRYYVQQHGSRKAASEFLDSLGIPGLKYLDSFSRHKGEGTSNYVIWDQETLDQIALLERNAQPLEDIQYSLDNNSQKDYNLKWYSIKPEDQGHNPFEPDPEIDQPPNETGIVPAVKEIVNAIVEGYKHSESLTDALLGDLSSVADRKLPEFLAAQKRMPEAETLWELEREGRNKMLDRLKRAEERLLTDHMTADKNFIISQIKKWTPNSPNLRDWMIKKFARVYSAIQSAKPIEQTLFTIAEHMYWDGEKMKPIPGFREINQQTGRFEYVIDPMHAKLAQEYFNNLSPEWKELLTERAKKNEDYRQGFVNLAVPWKTAQVSTALSARHKQIGNEQAAKRYRQQALGELARLPKNWNPRQVNELKSTLELLDNLSEMQISTMEKIVKENSGGNLKSIYALNKDLNKIESNQGIYGYVHHYFEGEFAPSKGKAFDALGKILHAWYEDVPGSRKMRSGAPGQLKNLLEADDAQIKKEIRSEAANTWMQKVEDQYGLLVTEADKTPDMVPDGYESRRKVVANFGKYQGDQIYLPDSVFEHYQMVKARKNIGDPSLKEFNEALGALEGITNRVNYAMLYHTGKIARDIISQPFHLAEFIMDWSIKHPFEIPFMMKALATSIPEAMTPRVWQKHTPETFGDYEEALPLRDSQGPNVFTRTLNKLIKGFPLGSVAAKFLTELNLAGAGNLPIMRVMRLVGEKLADKRGLTGKERDRFVWDVTNEYGYYTYDLPRAAAYLRGQRPTQGSKTLGMLSRTSVPFMGYGTRLFKQMIADPALKGLFPASKRLIGQGSSEPGSLLAEISETTRPLRWLFLLNLLKSGVFGLLPPEEEGMATDIQDRRGLDPMARTAGRLLVKQDEDPEGGEYWLTSKGMGPMQAAHALDGVLTGQTKFTDFSTEFLSLHPNIQLLLGTLGIDSPYSRNVPINARIGRFIATVVAPEMIRFGPDIAKLARMLLGSNTIPDNRKQNFLTAFFEQLGAPIGPVRVDRQTGELILTTPEAEQLKFVGLNMRYIPYRLIASEAESETRSLGSLTGRYKTIQRYKAGELNADMPELEFIRSRLYDQESETLEEAEQKLLDQIKKRGGGAYQTILKLKDKGVPVMEPDPEEETKPEISRKKKKTVFGGTSFSGGFGKGFGKSSWRPESKKKSKQKNKAEDLILQLKGKEHKEVKDIVRWLQEL